MPRDSSLSNSGCTFMQAEHWENYIYISFHIEWDMIVATVFLSILNEMEIHSIQNRKENFPHDHIPFNVKGIGNIVFSVKEIFARARNRKTKFNARQPNKYLLKWNFDVLYICIQLLLIFIIYGRTK